jgi:hypothetical protein
MPEAVVESGSLHGPTTASQLADHKFMSHWLALAARKRHLTLHQAQLYGYLVARYGGLYRPGGNHPVCGPKTAQEMVRLGWLIFQGGRYSITEAGQRDADPAN